MLHLGTCHTTDSLPSISQGTWLGRRSAWQSIGEVDKSTPCSYGAFLVIIFAGLNCLTKCNSSCEIDPIDFSFFYTLCHLAINFVIRLYTLSFGYILCHSAIYFVILLYLYILRHSAIHFIIRLYTLSFGYTFWHSAIYTLSFGYTLCHSAIHFVIRLYTLLFGYILRHSDIYYSFVYTLGHSAIAAVHTFGFIVLNFVTRSAMYLI